jgi:hypothetical protein
MDHIRANVRISQSGDRGLTQYLPISPSYDQVLIIGAEKNTTESVDKKCPYVSFPYNQGVSSMLCLAPCRHASY